MSMYGDGAAQKDVALEQIQQSVLCRDRDLESVIRIGCKKELRQNKKLEMCHFASAWSFAKGGFVSEGWMTIRVKIDNLDKRKVLRTSSVPLNADTPVCVFCLENPQTSGFAHQNTWVLLVSCRGCRCAC